jgi:hypothetical protein
VTAIVATSERLPDRQIGGSSRALGFRIRGIRWAVESDAGIGIVGTPIRRFRVNV